ncbi:Fe-S cluster assembly protein SufD [Desertivibrio insolitus]|uniref:Fe-S cluster assembly protein SufD n=1 Tax=Herbiconiux sp. SYSU D00978 TaxID=2812562 RepID=UPI001A95724E|nr:Fe-S cluster assembly protein SufD [Herbiconiux sp. SYSU D00978]
MTTAETTPAQHGLTEHSHGGWGKGTVPVQTRSERFTSTDPSAFPDVTGQEFEWKFMPVRRITELTSGSPDGSPADIDVQASAGASVEWVGMDHALIGTAGIPEEKAAALAWSTAQKALSVAITGEEGEHVVLTRSSLPSTATSAHTVISAAPNSRGTVVLQNRGKALLTENVEIVVGEGADLTVVSVQEWDDEAIHLSSHFARIGRDAKLKHFVVSLGGSVVRVVPTAHLAEQGGDVELYGVYFADAGQHLEQRPYVNHDAPHTRSRVNYKGALQGEGARTVWVGDVLIGREATGTDSYEQNRNLVLSDGTRADSIPNLEIETGDIEGAGHASATGRFDDEHLFYLASRGIPEDEARRMVVLGFLAEIVQQIGVPDLEERLIEAIVEELAQGGAL